MKFGRPLSGCAVNVSVSEGDDSAAHGFPAWQVNRTTLQIATALFGQGATVVFGHDWRPDGVMEAICTFARQVQPPLPLAPEEAQASGQPLLLNVLPWPDHPVLSEPDLARLRSTLRIESAGLPAELEGVDQQARSEAPTGRLYRYARARGLTSLRYRLNDVSHARLCLGGRRGGAQGRYPGVVEEAYLAVKARKPLYIAGLLGGAAQQVIAAIEGAEIPDDFCDPKRTPPLDVYEHPPFKESADTEDDRVLNREIVWKAFAETKPEGIAAANGLTVEQNRELFHTPVLDRAIELMLAGLAQLRPEWSSKPIARAADGSQH